MGTSGIYHTWFYMVLGTAAKASSMLSMYQLSSRHTSLLIILLLADHQPVQHMAVKCLLTLAE